MQRCSSCKVSTATPKRCSGCSSAYYCSADCQRAHWSTHKPHCLRQRCYLDCKDAFVSLAGRLQDTGLLKTLSAIKEYALSERVGGFNCFTFTPADETSPETATMKEALKVPERDTLYTVTPTVQGSERVLEHGRLAIALLDSGFHMGDCILDRYALSGAEARQMVIGIFGTAEKARAYLSREDVPCYVICVPSTSQLHVISA
jgi:hypothetical protein